MRFRHSSLSSLSLAKLMGSRIPWNFLFGPVKPTASVNSSGCKFEMFNNTFVVCSNQNHLRYESKRYLKYDPKSGEVNVLVRLGLDLAK